MTVTITVKTQYRPVVTYCVSGGSTVFIYHQGMKKVAPSTGISQAKSRHFSERKNFENTWS